MLTDELPGLLVLAPDELLEGGRLDAPLPAAADLDRREVSAADERVRLRFCRDRWNEHPDCMVEPPRTSF